LSVLKVENLTKIFLTGYKIFNNLQKHLVVNDVSFQLNKGEILGLLGPNGSGKTTTIQMLLGTLLASSGSIKYFGQDFSQSPCKFLKKIGYASGYDRFPARLTILDNLDVVGRIYGITQPELNNRIERLLKYFGIWDIRNQQAGSLSAGQVTRVMLAKAFLLDPEIVLLDEPTASLDPEIAYQVRQFILAQRQEKNVSILITSHNMAEVAEICDRVIVLKKGEIIANETPDLLMKSILKVHVHLTISQRIDYLIKYLQESKIIHSIQDNNVTVEIDEHDIAKFIIDLGSLNIIYSSISIDKPTLEDYFLSIAK